jgi:hypothetical protein
VLHEHLRDAWSERKRAVPICAALHISPNGLVLGAGTILLPAEGGRRLAKLQGQEARLLALLSATYGRPIAPSVLGNIERAAKSWRDGDDLLAAIHLAHARLPQPDDPHESARRLFITDAFINAGTSPLAILRTLDLDDSYLKAVEKLYNPLEPRVPAGNSVFSGRWTKALSFLTELTATQATRLGAWALAQLGLEAAGGALVEAAGAVAVAGVLVVPWQKSVRVEGEIRGLPGGRYWWNRDEARLHITYEAADGQQRTFIAQRQEREFLDPQGRVVGRILPNDTVVIDADVLPGRPANDNEPKLCPLPQPDRRTNDKGLAYEAFMRPLVNPGMPTPLGWGYYLKIPDSGGKSVEFDDCQHVTGIVMDYKDRYWKLLSNLDTQGFTIGKLWKQALDQVQAARDREIHWYFSEKEAADYVRDLFDRDDDRGRIKIFHVPMPEGAR